MCGIRNETIRTAGRPKRWWLAPEASYAVCLESLQHYRSEIIPSGYPTAFGGRTQELADITTRLLNPECQLLTLTGLGGSGKTAWLFRLR